MQSKTGWPSFGRATLHLWGLQEAHGFSHVARCAVIGFLRTTSGMVSRSMEPQDAKRMSRRRRGIIMGVAGAVLVLLVLGAAASSLPSGCSSVCHRAQAKALASDEHSNVSCYRCHLARGAWSYPGFIGSILFRMNARALTGSGYHTAVVQTSRSACIRCHEGTFELTSESGGIRIKHSSCAPGPTCDSCHATVAHGSAVRWDGTYSMDDCVACHRAQNAPIACDTCHAQKARAARTRGAWQVTHGPNWEKTHGLGDLDTCGTCHGEGFCEKCHKAPVPHPEDWGGTHGQYAIEDRASCETCHSSSAWCASCHGRQMPHPSGFLQEHSSIASGLADPECIRCHDKSDCGTCHTYHVHPGGSLGVPVPPTATDAL